MKSLEQIVISPELPLSEALAQLDRAGTGALVLCTQNGKLFGLLTDGDIRRALMRNMALDTPSEQIANLEPIFVKSDCSRHDALQLMIMREIDHLPVVDDHGLLCDFLLRKVLVGEETLKKDSAERIHHVIIRPDQSISEAISRLDQAGTGALAVCSVDHKIEGILSDGDIRRAILRGIPMESPCGEIASRDPFKARYPMSDTEALKLMNDREINHLPVVNAHGKLIDFLLRRDLSKDDSLIISAVIMAGGFGKRLMPLTEKTPKPMLPIGNRPLLERTIGRLRQEGIQDVRLTTHYLSENIQKHFGNGEHFGVRIEYAHEENSMGTAGGLKLLSRPTKPFIVINGDILTGVSFQEMYNFHKYHQPLMTVGVRKYEVKVPFGVIECEDFRITALKEKPSLSFFINAGVYLLEPMAFDMIPEGVHFDMTDLIEKILQSGHSVVGFPITEYWLDIGHYEDYQKAQEDILGGKI